MTTLPTARSGAEIDAFLDQLKTPAPRSSVGSGRLIIGIDATASREGTWDTACRIHGEMFEATAGIGGLEIQLVYYRGFSECKSSRGVTTPGELHQLMRSVHCVGGHTQIGRVLDHTIRETQARKVDALVFVGDAMEEDADRLCHLAGELGRVGTPIFMFHEGHDPTAGAAFKQIASLSGGAYAAFDSASAERLKILARRGRGLCDRWISGARKLRRKARRRGVAANPSTARRALTMANNRKWPWCVLDHMCA